MHEQNRCHPSMKELTIPPPTKPSIGFVHGLWADGSCVSKLIPTLQAEGHEVIASTRPRHQRRHIGRSGLPEGNRI